VAAGDTPYVLNYLNTAAKFGWLNGNSEACLSAVVAPAVLFDSLDLARLEEKGNNPPVVPAPDMVSVSTPVAETCGPGCQTARPLSTGLRVASK
jgi:hypothetical protein